MPKNLEIVINQDQKCSKCGKGGAVESSGVCLSCTSKLITGKFEGHVKGLHGRAETITEQMILGAIEKLTKYLYDHHLAIDKAFNNLEEDETGYKVEKLVISLKVKFEQMGKKIAMQTEIQFSTGKVKDGDKVIFDDKQPRIGEGF